MRYILIDTANLFFRARHTAHRASDSWTKLGLALHVTLAGINKLARTFEPDHIIFALEGRSWRKDFYEPYKKNRAVARAALTEAEQEEDKLFWETYDQLTQYLNTRTNCSVIRCATAEADDIIARWIALHPADHHTIVSNDSDFEQLVAENVQLYNGVAGILTTVNGQFNDRNKPVVDKKTKQVVPAIDPGWILFEKCMRGDTSDNVFSAYPGVREKGTKNKVGLREAYGDKSKKGFNWNNLMLQRWTDHNGNEHRVLDDYERNRTLIDLNAQPNDVKVVVDQCIREQISHKDVGQVGSHFLKFCAKYELTKLSENATQMGHWLNQTYKGVLNDSRQTNTR
jgi:5'-3' exonuclease